MLASLEAAAREAEVAAAKIDVAVKGSVAAMDTVVASVISTVKSTSGSGKLAAAENIVVQVLSKKINEKMAEEAAKITDAPVGADLASMDVASISTVVDSVQEKVAQAKNQIAALPPEEKTSAMADALVKAEATATKAKSRPKRPLQRFLRKLLPRSERGLRRLFRQLKRQRHSRTKQRHLSTLKKLSERQMHR